MIHKNQTIDITHDAKESMNLLHVKETIQLFRQGRGWLESDSPYNLAKSVFVEASELLECFQFGEEGVNEMAVKGELADVLMYALSLCYEFDWEPQEVIAEKMVDVARRYPKVNE